MHALTCSCSHCVPAQSRANGASGAGRASEVLTETQELELALELLEVSNEAELEQFLGNIFKGIAKVGKKLVSGPLGGALKALAKKALPMVGGALGSFIPIPGVGTALGTALGSAASKALETELEGVDREVAELETAQRFVRLAADAARGYAEEISAGAAADAAARTALLAATRRHVPQLDLRQSSTAAGESGRWVRQHGRITVLNV